MMTGTAQQSSRRLADETAERLLLIIEDDEVERAAKIRALAGCEHASVLAARSRDCVEVATAVSPRALLIEATEAGEIGSDVHRVLERDHRISAVVLGHERAERARRRYPRWAARFHGITVPVRAEEIAAFIAQPPLPESWAGFFTPAECLRAAGIGDHSLSIDCIASDGSRLGSIALERGTILAAQTASRTGFDAFRELVTKPGVRAVMRPPGRVEPHSDLAGGWEAVLLEALRLHDEERRAAPPAPLAGSRVFEGAEGTPPAGRAPVVAEPQRGRQQDVQELVDLAIQAVLAKDYDTAVEALERARRLDPSDMSIPPRLARLYARNSVAR